MPNVLFNEVYDVAPLPESFPSFMDAIEFALEHGFADRDELQHFIISFLSDEHIITLSEFGHLIDEAFGED